MIDFAQAAAVLTYGMAGLSGLLAVLFAFFTIMNRTLPTGYRIREPSIFPTWVMTVFSVLATIMWWKVGDYLWKVGTTGAG